MSNKYIHLTATGHVGKRTSQNRAYTHAIVQHIDADQRVAFIERYRTVRIAQAVKSAKWSHGLDSARVAAPVGAKAPYDDREWFNDADDQAKAVAELAKFPAVEARTAAYVARETEKIEAEIAHAREMDGVQFVVAWAGNAALAAKAAAAHTKVGYVAHAEAINGGVRA